MLTVTNPGVRGRDLQQGTFFSLMLKLYQKYISTFWSCYTHVKQVKKWKSIDHGRGKAERWTALWLCDAVHTASDIKLEMDFGYLIEEFVKFETKKSSL